MNDVIEMIPGIRQIIPKSPRDKALHCCRLMSASFGVVHWPMALRTGDSARYLGEVGQRRSYEHQTACVLRGAFWARVCLSQTVQADGSDAEAIDMLGALDRYLDATWGVGNVPEDLSERDSKARDLAHYLSTIQVWRTEYQHQWPAIGTGVTA